MASCVATVIAMRAAKLGVALTEPEVTVESDSDARGILGLDRKLVEWADAHSPVGCTVRQPPECSLDMEVV
jgi:uncharacterized OsmC-like protein